MDNFTGMVFEINQLSLSTSESMAYFLKSKIGPSDAEEFWAMALNSKCELIEAKMLFRGTVDHCFIHPRDIFRFALKANASFVVIGHNHPSGHLDPSPEDLEMTKKLIRIGKLIQIPVLDHVIVCQEKERHFSFLKNSGTDFFPGRRSAAGSLL